MTNPRCLSCGEPLMGDGVTVVRRCLYAGRVDTRFFKPDDKPVACCQCTNPDSRAYCVQCHPYWGYGDTDADPESFVVPGLPPSLP